MADQLVQIGHACLEAGRRFGHDLADQIRLVVIGVPSQEALLIAIEKVNWHGIQTALFYEPDDGMGYTAACTEPVLSNQRRVFRKFPLWKE